MNVFAPDRAVRQRPRLILLAVCLAVLMVPVSLSGISVALPAIGQSLHAGIVPLQWSVNAYSVSAASFVLATGSLADIVGRRRMFVAGTALFGLSSLVCALATNIYLLDSARALAGLGAAAIITAGTAVVATTFQGPARNRAFAMTGVVVGAGLALGPTTSGWLIALMGWRGIFLSQLLIAVVVLCMVRVLPESHDVEAERVDWAGTSTFTSSLFVLTVAVAEGPQLGWTSPAMLGLVVVFALLLAGFVLAERRQDRPMFDLSLFTQPRFVALCLLPVVFAFGFVGLVVLIPSYLIGANGESSSTAGLTMLLLTGPVLVVPLLAARLLQWGVSTRVLLAGSLLVTTLGVAWLTVIHPGIGWLVLLGPMLTVGIGQGLSSGLMDGAAVSSVEPSRAGMAAGMFNTMRLAGEAVAIAAMGGVLVSLIQGRLSHGIGAFSGQTSGTAHSLANKVASGNISGPAASVPGPHHAAFTHFLSGGYTDAMHIMLWAIAAFCGVATVVVYVLLAERPAARAVPPSDPDPDAAVVALPVEPEPEPEQVSR